MKLASIKNSTRDGKLVVVSSDLTTAVAATQVAPTLQAALERWSVAGPQLNVISERLNAGQEAGAFAFDPVNCMAPLPRAYQFVDASAFLNHGDILEEAYKVTVKKIPGVPILVQRQGDAFLGPHDDYPIPSESDDPDFEGEFAAILGDVPMGTRSDDAQQHIKLVTLLNDVSMRAHMLRELGMGFGFIQAKPATAFAPVAVTPDELGPAWSHGRIHLDLRVSRNGAWFGHPNGREMDFCFGELIAHLAYSRRLGAGTILGSGTVSNKGYRQVGSACLAERRAAEMISHGDASTPFLKFGDVLRFEVFDVMGRSVFGAIEHRMVRSISE
ncbi:fumarylacetoacetate hydrolase family protein [Polaromonas sp. C04]|uniref:fumarylacetoacetate hydrolase family protein n=1 Tax=Polaromonas sp. C04 TaxID=1945857 RepID=UPI000987CF3D|nr:fumarylacetoacetate hydrolase family protein [Polaromonas sp. C04]OOG53123.1 fumarylacetoacetate hydrolase [Polaromonas sp. C04]